MKKTLVMILILAALLFGVYYYFQPRQVDRWLREAKLLDTPEVTRVYKWQDRNGNWHISNLPPPQGIDFRIEEYRSDENILPLPPQLQAD